MIHNLPRIGNFSSSEIVALTKKAKDGKSFGAPAITYIEETNMERLLGRSLTTEIDARATSWGTLLEPRVFDMLGLEYTLSSKETIVHPTIPFWVGSPDGSTPNTTADFKAPLTLKSFCQLVQPLYEGLTGKAAMDRVREDHKDGEKFYWQIVSNAILQGNDFGELIPYMPYHSELDAIRTMARHHEQAGKYKWVDYASDDELPYLIEGGYYKNLNIIRFEIPEADKKFLTDCVVRAGERLLKEPCRVLMATHDKTTGAILVEDANALKISNTKLPKKKLMRLLIRMDMYVLIIRWKLQW
jgi:hypothetical protein